MLASTKPLQVSEARWIVKEPLGDLGPSLGAFLMLKTPQGLF